MWRFGGFESIRKFSTGIGMNGRIVLAWIILIAIVVVSFVLLFGAMPLKAVLVFVGVIAAIFVLAYIITWATCVILGVR